MKCSELVLLMKCLELFLDVILIDLLIAYLVTLTGEYICNKLAYVIYMLRLRGRERNIK